MGKASSLFSVNLRERIKTILIIVVGAIAVAVKNIMDQGGTLPSTFEEWKAILLYGVYAGITYFVVTFVTNGTNPNPLEKVLTKDKNTLNK